jgi:UDP-N-acetylmuramate: L-alanyl-gamma-D-glutamyl-meso-diaminopimelate ligase
MKESLFFIRIGGTAMGGVAAACQALGHTVSGSEETLYEPMKSYLYESGVKVFESFDPQNMINAGADRIVVGNAVSRGNEELETALDHRLRLVSLPQLISENLISRNRCVVVTGTHGKTTTTSMTAWLLEAAGRNPGFMIGGVPGNFDVSCRPSGHHDTDSGLFVIEGDEYDSAYFDKRSKFLWYRADIAILNNLEHDHADIFADVEAVKASFKLFLRNVPRGGLESAPVQTFGLEPDAFWRAEILSTTPELVTFDVFRQGEKLGTVESPALGEHNVRNMLAAIATAIHIGVPFEQVQNGVRAYRLPKRRMEEIGEWQGATVIDDFAHHPTAIRLTIQAVKAKYPGRRVVMVFEPRSNSTTRNLFEKEFETCFNEASAVVFGALDRPWRYQESERLNTARIAADYTERGIPATAISLEEGKDPEWSKFILPFLGAHVRPGDVLLLGSNGDLGGLRAALKATTVPG